MDEDVLLPEGKEAGEEVPVVQRRILPVGVARGDGWGWGDSGCWGGGLGKGIKDLLEIGAGGILGGGSSFTEGSLR